MASSYVVVNSIGAVSPVSVTETSKRFALGLEMIAVDNQTGASSVNVGAGRFVYCQGSNVTAVGQFVHISSNSAVLLAAANSTCEFPVGVAAGNLSATSVFGWVQVQGLCDYAKGTNSSIAAAQQLYIAAGTAGFLVTNVVTGNRVQGVAAYASYTSSQSNSLSVQLQYPRIVGVADSRS